MHQEIYVVGSLPRSSLAACAEFVANHLPIVQEKLDAEKCDSLAIVLPSGSVDEDDWRRALALDLAREYRPKRVNVLGSADLAAAKDGLAYLRNAQGVTGQYLQSHE
ncbi:MAG: Rossmann fold domain-containing protein [Pseudomonadota bacterium]